MNHVRCDLNQPFMLAMNAVAAAAARRRARAIRAALQEMPETR